MARPIKVQEYTEGRQAASNFKSAMKSILKVSKQKVLQLEKEASNKKTDPK